MTTEPQDHATEANYRLIAQAAEYYNHAINNIDFYKELNSITLQEISKVHLLHWKSELKSLIFNGMNCTNKRST